MLTLVEKIVFTSAVLVTLYLTYRSVLNLVKIIARGHGRPDWRLAQKRLAVVFFKTIALAPTWRIRLGPSIMHGLVAWGFMYYLLVNLGDVYEGFVSGSRFLGEGWLGNFYRLGADVLTVLTLAGMVALLLRRLLFRSPALATRETTLLHPKARAGILRDSTIVGSFIMLHVGFRFIGQSFTLALEKGMTGSLDSWQPFASAMAKAWAGWSETSLTIGQHIGFWMALGLILAFFPYFPYSKHIHIIFAPLKLLIKPDRRSIGELGSINFDDETIEQFGVSRLEDLGYEQLVDAYACIMCYRCQQVCPAYNTGKVLSPAALEINKRYFLNSEGSRLARGEPTAQTMLEFAIPAEAVWACTACGACVDICPVGNEPMRDILEIRRSLVLMENDFPTQWQNAFRGMERNANPWNISTAERMKWADGLDVPVIGQEPGLSPDILWWVGCAPATDMRAQKTARAFAALLNQAGVNYAVLGQAEQCTGDSARRAGNEYLFFELAKANVEILNEVCSGQKNPRIVTTCPHCLHTLKNEYPAFGGNYDVIHHSELLNELVSTGKLTLQTGNPTNQEAVRLTFHDPCYLGRHNNQVSAPRIILDQMGSNLVEMSQAGRDSFCCGAGGAQFWKEEEHGDEGVNLRRFKQALATGADTVAVGCPFCMVMLTDAGKDMNSEIGVKDIAEIMLESLENPGRLAR